MKVGRTGAGGHVVGSGDGEGRGLAVNGEELGASGVEEGEESVQENE